jgi:hypothetical protein
MRDDALQSKLCFNSAHPTQYHIALLGLLFGVTVIIKVIAQFLIIAIHVGQIFRAKKKMIHIVAIAHKAHSIIRLATKTNNNGDISLLVLTVCAKVVSFTPNILL